MKQFLRIQNTVFYKILLLNEQAKMFIAEPTCNVLLTYPLEYFHIENSTKHSLEYANLWSNSKGQQHHEKNDRPERWNRKLHDSLGKHDKC